MGLGHTHSERNKLGKECGESVGMERHKEEKGEGELCMGMEKVAREGEEEGEGSGQRKEEEEGESVAALLWVADGVGGRRRIVAEEARERWFRKPEGVGVCRWVNWKGWCAAEEGESGGGSRSGGGGRGGCGARRCGSRVGGGGHVAGEGYGGQGGAHMRGGGATHGGGSRGGHGGCRGGGGGGERRRRGGRAREREPRAEREWWQITVEREVLIERVVWSGFGGGRTEKGGGRWRHGGAVAATRGCSGGGSGGCTQQ